MKEHKHKCPICKRSHICSISGKNNILGIKCMDKKDSYCDPCQIKNFDKIVLQLKKEKRIQRNFNLRC